MALRSLQQILDSRRGGRWKINDRHEVEYWVQGDRSRAAVTATLLDVRPAALVLEYRQEDQDGGIVSQVHELRGAWRVDSRNRIAFTVTREAGPNHTLTLRGGWTINDRNEIEYTYSTGLQGSKSRGTRKLVWKGAWDIASRSQIVYWLGGEADGALRFRGAFQTRSILAKKGEIRYQIGVEVERKVRTRTVTLFGAWKYSRDLGLRFEVEYADGRRRAIGFGGEFHPTPDSGVEISLKARDGRGLGVELVVTRDLGKSGGQAFVRALRDAAESRVEAGVTVKW